MFDCIRSDPTRPVAEQLRYDMMNHASRVIAMFWLGYKRRKTTKGSKRAFLIEQALNLSKLPVCIYDFSISRVDYLVRF